MVSLLFPEATPEQIQRAKRYMSEYRRAKKLIETFPSSIREKDAMLVHDIEKAIAIILDEEIHKIIEYRYVKGNSHKTTLTYFSARGLSERTIARKLEEGIKTIAESLVICGQLETMK